MRCDAVGAERDWLSRLPLWRFWLEEEVEEEEEEEEEQEQRSRGAALGSFSWSS